MKKITTRFAPSPTGYLHIGGLRTALFNYLWAKKNKGDFRLRIEDTDQKREVHGAAEHLIRTLTGLGLRPDHDVVIQSARARKGVYKKIAADLVAKDLAYYSDPDEDAAEDRNRRDSQHKKEDIDKPTEPAIRLRLPKNEVIHVSDEIHGNVSFHTKDLNECVLLKSDGMPTYHLAHVVDDHQMGITDVIRGEEWLPSLPLHVTLYSYLGYEIPKFYHLPLILNPDKSKLSKRQGDVAVEDFLEKGYLTEALLNYIAFLGWNPGDEREIFSLDELVSEFDIAHVNKSGAIFDTQRLNWYNNWYIKNTLAPKSHEEILNSIKKYLPDSSDEDAVSIFNMFFERLNTLSELPELSKFLYALPDYNEQQLVFKKSTPEKTMLGLEESLNAINKYSGKWTAINLELELKNVVEEHNLTFGDVFWPVRFAVSGLQASPPPTDILAFLGKEEGVARIKQAITALSKYIS